jgi:UDP-N-acetylmuramate--alanine ligase
LKAINTYQTVYFIGIGGIGMSALARYFKAIGKEVLGYDKTETALTQKLTTEGVKVHYQDTPGYLEACDAVTTLVVVTPAIPKENKELQLAFSKYDCLKRAELLGLISQDKTTIAVAGTHGKTTTSAMIAHLFHSASKDVTAFLGGISTNFNSNLVIAESDKVVVEADEFDRSFLKLSPNTAIVTSMDADHLDIYSDAQNIESAFLEFMSLVPDCGHLIIKNGLPHPEGVIAHTYGLDDSADLYADNVRIENGDYVFDLKGAVEMSGIVMGMPGIHNVENALAACLACLHNGMTMSEIKVGLRTFAGVKRRFEYCIRKENLVYIDDYAHHPTELERCITSVRQLYPGKKVTGVFQPHLYSRTRDFADGFAESLGLLDELFLLDIYPARELPISGVDSEWLLAKVTLNSKELLSKSNAVERVKSSNPEVLLTLGAGDIDKLVQPLTEALQ